MPLPSWITLNFPPQVDHRALYLHLIINWGKVVIVLAFCAWSLGMFNGLGFGSGFARAADVDQLQAEVRSASVSSISTSLFQMWRDKCALEVDAQLRELLQKQILEGMREYQRLVGNPYPINSCETFR